MEPSPSAISQQSCSSMEPSPSAAAPENAPAAAVPSSLSLSCPVSLSSQMERRRRRKRKDTDPSPSTAAPRNVPAAVVATQHNPNQGEEEAKRMVPSSSTSALGNVPASGVATQNNPNKGEEEEARRMVPSSSTAALENVPALVVATQHKLNRGEEARSMFPLPSTAVEELLQVPVAGTLDNPLLVDIGERWHHVVITNKAEEASEWVRRLPEEKEGMINIIGLSSYQCGNSRHDGYVFRRIASLHLAFLSQVLVYYLGSPEHTLYSLEVMSFLRRPANVFVGPDVDETLYLLGLPFLIENRRTMDLASVARILGAGNVIPIAQQIKVPLHVLLAKAFLGIHDLRVNVGRRTSVNWPMTPEQEEFAIQGSVIAQNLGIKALLRVNMPPPN